MAGARRTRPRVLFAALALVAAACITPGESAWAEPAAEVGISSPPAGEVLSPAPEGEGAAGPTLQEIAHLAGRPVRSVDFAGQEALSGKQLAEVIYLERSSRWPWGHKEPFLPREFLRDRRRLEILYERHGFPDAVIQPRALQSGDGVRVEFEIVEGRPIIVAAIELAGWPLTSPASAEVRDGLPLAVGERFERERIDSSISSLRSTLSRYGHWRAEVEEAISISNYQATVTFDVRPGPVYRVSEIHLEPFTSGGFKKIPLWMVRDEIPLEPGDVFDPGELDRARRRLYKLDLFRRVEIEPRTAGSDRVDVDFRLAARHPRSTALGIGYGTEERIRLRVSWLHRNFLGGARRLIIEARYSSIRWGGTVEFTQRRLWKSHADMTLRWFPREETEDNYDLRRVGGAVRISHPLPGQASVSLALATEADDLTIEVPDEALPEAGASRLTELQLALARDTSDDRLSPRRGSRLLVEASAADEHTRSDYSYGTVEVVTTRYLPLAGDRVLAWRMRGGLAAPRGNTELPVQRRLYGGGPTGLRSYLRRTVGPLDSEGNGIGGEVAVELMGEWRVPLVWRLSGVLFAELGEVWRKIEAVRIASLNSGAGTGLRVATPVGPIRLDVGWKLSDFDPELAPIAVHVSIGEAF